MEGEFWTIAIDRRLVRLRDAKGLRYIAVLLQQPGTKIHAAELTGSRVAWSAERERLKVTQRIKATLRKIAQSDPVLGEHLASTIRTGLFCSYEPQEPLSWTL